MGRKPERRTRNRMRRSGFAGWSVFDLTVCDQDEHLCSPTLYAKKA
jgi:hypothetical protein